MLLGTMERLDKMKALYDDLLEQYGELSDREIKMMEWIIKKRNEQRRAKK
jgi:hypothetical protein